MTTNKKETKQPQETKTKTKGKLSTTTIILIIGCTLIAIPFIVLGVILIQASFDTGKPIIGDRFEGDLDPSINQDDIDEIIVKCKAIQNVDDCYLSLKTATLRLYVDTKDTVQDEEMDKVADAAYAAVVNRLPANKYFTSSSTKKMYDIEIHTYNSLDKIDSDDYMYIIKNKSSNMLEPKNQVVSEALDPELAEQLRQDVENRKNPKPTEEPEIEVGGGESEETEGDE